MKRLLIALIAASCLTFGGLTSTSEANRRWHRDDYGRHGYRHHWRRYDSYPRFHSNRSWRYPSYRYHRHYHRPYGFGYRGFYGPGFSVWW